MIECFEQIVAERASVRTAAGAFTCYDVSTALGVCQAAEDRNAPVILLVAESTFRSRLARLLVPALRAVAEAATVPVCLQLDHVTSLDLVAAAVEAGFGAVMADGSRLPFADNSAFVREAVVIARRHKAAIESELGHIEGSEDFAIAVTAGALTDPAEAEEFVRTTGAECLAVSIGNVHGTYRELPTLDWDRLTAVQQRATVPLSLHGASGIPDADVRRAVSLGIAKVNVNTELRQRTFAEIAVALEELSPGYRMLDLNARLVDAVADVAGAKIDLLAAA